MICVMPALKQEEEIINICKTLLADGTADAVLAYADKDGIGAVLFSESGRISFNEMG